MRKTAPLLIISFFLAGCASKSTGSDLATIHLVDRNGFQETISSPDRIAQLEKNNFLETQPYDKVVRVYKKNKEGKNEGRLTTYHQNGGVKQYLETVSGRAKGIYKEWYENGQLRMIAQVLEGIGDLTPEAQGSWVFDGNNFVYDENGRLMAEIVYEKGKLESPSRYYYPEGGLAKIIPYHQDTIEGTMRLFSKEGVCIGETNYRLGNKEGKSFFRGNEHLPQREEEYKNGKLFSGVYWDFSHAISHEIVAGTGVKPIFEGGVLRVEEQYKNGQVSGEVKFYRENGQLESLHHIREGQKEGEEWCYYENPNDELHPMLSLNWRDDEIHGLVRTWYPTGILESEKELAHNKKQGMSLAWYEDGTLMLLEEYENDQIRNGKYFKRGESTPVSQIAEGNGRATLFDGEGNFLRKIEYRKGAPTEE